MLGGYDEITAIKLRLAMAPSLDVLPKFGIGQQISSIRTDWSTKPLRQSPRILASPYLPFPLSVGPVLYERPSQDPVLFGLWTLHPAHRTLRFDQAA